MEATCPNTGVPTDRCRCAGCTPLMYHIPEMIGSCSSFEELIQRLELTTALARSLSEQGYTLGSQLEQEVYEVLPPDKVGYYWVQCDSCGTIRSEPIGKKPKRLCRYCLEQPVPIPSSNLFGDLVLYLVEVFDRKRSGEYRPYKHVELFCEHNDLDTERVCALLKANGAHNDVEVLLNCLDHIPPYQELPATHKEPHQISHKPNNSGPIAQEG